MCAARDVTSEQRPASEGQRVKTLVVYYSRTGNTKLIGHEIAAALGADVEELKDGKNRAGPIGFLLSGMEAKRKTPVQLEKLVHNPAEYDVVVVGSPIWASTISTPTRTFLHQHRDSLKSVAWFCTSGSVAGETDGKGFAAMTEESRLSPIATLGLCGRHVKGDHDAAVRGFVSAIARDGSSADKGTA